MNLKRLAALIVAGCGLLPAQEIAGCPVFPKNNVWNVPIDKLSVHANSARIIQTVGPDRNLHPDFSASGGIPFNVVPANQPMVPITFESGDSDPGPYPIPPNPVIESGTDAHVVVVQQGECRLYEVFLLQKGPTGAWRGSSGAIFNLRGNELRPDGWTSADAAGLPILPGLVRYDEIASGEIRHALRFTVPTTKREYIWPARHFASRTDDSIYPPMGLRMRLKANYDISRFHPEVQVLLRALKKYGMILSDNGSPWFITGATDSRWNDEIWAQLKQVKGGDLEAVDGSSLMISPNSAQAGTVATIGRNDVAFSPTPTFDPTGGGTQTIRLTGNVVSSTVINLIDGAQVGFLICQDDQGGRTFAWPPNVRGGMQIGSAPKTCSAQQFISDGKGLYATSPGVADLAAVD
jgi:hypothetical protein